MKKVYLRRIFSVALLALLTGCTQVIPDPIHKPIVVPESWDRIQSTQQPLLNNTWWEAFAVPALITLLEEAEQENPDLRITLLRLEQANLTLAIRQADRLPNIAASVGGNIRYNQTPDTTNTTRSSSLGLSLGYELDLWGRRANERLSAQALAEASRYDSLRAKLILQSALANGYFAWLHSQAQSALIQENLNTAKQILKSIEARAAQDAQEQKLAIRQQQSLLLQQEAALLPFALAQEQQALALALLLGQVPQGYAPPPGDFSQLGIPTLLPSLPADVLSRRPDVAAAEARLLAANANIAVARAAFLPTFSLSPASSINRATLLSISDPTFSTSLALSLGKTLFDGGQRQKNLAITTAEGAIILESYGQVIRRALQEVEAALSEVATRQQQETLQQNLVKNAKQVLQLAQEQYQQHPDSFLTLRDAQKQLFAAQSALLEQRLARLQAILKLYQSLGGAWPQTDLPSAPTAEKN